MSHSTIGYPLMYYLLKEYQLTSTGTFHKNKVKIPEEMLPTSRKVYSIIFGFQEDVTSAAYMTKEHQQHI